MYLRKEFDTPVRIGFFITLVAATQEMPHRVMAEIFPSSIVDV